MDSLNPIDAIDAQNEAQYEAQNDAQKSSIREKIINLINEHPRITRRQMAERISVSKATIERELSKSKDIHFVGASKTGHWEIIPKKED